MYFESHSHEFCCGNACRLRDPVAGAYLFNKRLKELSFRLLAYRGADDEKWRHNIARLTAKHCLNNGQAWLNVGSQRERPSHAKTSPSLSLNGR